MGNNLIGRQSVPLGGFGGLITVANPSDLPENASPRNWDVDFTIGGFQQRAGLYAALQPVAPIHTNFLFAKTFQQPSGQVNSIVEGANGVLYSEDVTSNSGVLSVIFNYINPGMSMFSSTNSNREYMCFSQISDPTSQGDVPRQWAGPGPNATYFDRISQCAPGAPPAFISSLGSASAATITSWSIVSHIVTFTFTTGPTLTAGEIISVSGLVTGSYLNQTFTVLGSPAPTGTTFAVSFTHINASATEAGVATPQYSYPISSITQSTTGNVLSGNYLWSEGPGSTNAGYTITCYFASGSATTSSIQQALNLGFPVYIYVSGAQFGNGTQLVTSAGFGIPPNTDLPYSYFTFAAPSSNYQYAVGTTSGGTAPDLQFQLTAATIAASSPIPNLNIGDQILITGATPAGWNSTWTITQSLSGYTLSINSTSITANIGKYYYSYVSGGNFGAAPTANQLIGQLVTITGTLNGVDVMNVTDAVIASNGSDGGGQYFTVANFNVTTLPSQIEINSVATTSGTLFQIDPGEKDLGTSTNPIIGNSTTGSVTIVGGNSSQFPLTAGTRQAVCFFISRNGDFSPASTPVTFVTNADASYIYATNIPIGPPSTIARAIAITEAGANGVAGANFFTIETPVVSVLNNVKITYSSTVIQDNTTTNYKMTFDDFTLLNATAIDIKGFDLFNTVELGNAGWNISAFGRMFYGLVQNKVYNFTNMSFDGGYNANNLPLGWGVDAFSNPTAGNTTAVTAFNINNNVVTIFAANNFIVGQQVLITGLSTGTYLNNQVLTVLSTGLSSSQFTSVFTHVNASASDNGLATPQNTPGTLLNPVAYNYGNSYYVKNNMASTQATYGMLTQSAYQDYYGVNILNPQVQYGVRVTCRCPAGQQTGNFVVDLTANATATYGYSGYGVTYGVTYEAFTIPFSSMNTTQWKTFSGTLLQTPFQTQIPVSLLLRIWTQNIIYGGDCEVKSIEIYPLSQTIGFPGSVSVGVIGSYLDQPCSFDIVSGVINLGTFNQQQCYGGAIFNDTLYFLKEESIEATAQTVNQEPGNWAVKQVTDRCGTCGPYAYDIAKEYMVTACREGVFLFNGGEPRCINWENRELWNSINWSAGRTIWVKDDVVNHKVYVGIPLPTPNKWLPEAPVNANPTTPNVVLMLNHLGVDTFNDFAGSAGMHVTMFGTLADLDMRRKWTIWNIASPNGAFLTRQDILDKPIFFCNGNNSGKVYSLSATQFTDDGVIIDWDYCTYGFTNPDKAKENPLLGFHRKRYTGIQVIASSQGAPSPCPLNIDVLTDDIVTPLVTYSIWPPPQLTAPEIDYVRNLNTVGNRAYVEFSSGGIGTSANISKVILVGNADVHAPFPKIPGR